jgi:prepilin-type N-terminal cleavage/methylation domain-containing protein
MRRKGFTLVELLVVIAIIALLMGILMPALARVRQIAFRMVCGTNLSGIGKAMIIYSTDYEDELPRAGSTTSTWTTNAIGWNAANRYQAYGLNNQGMEGNVNITSSFYLLVKYAEVTPKSFVCKGDSGAGEFKPADYGAGNLELIDLWDFGPSPQTHCSYSLHMPYVANNFSYALTTSSEPGMAIAGDRNPFQASPSNSTPKDPKQYPPDGSRDQIRKLGNALQHQEDGQNVLFIDAHVYFEKRPSCGINDDNVYTWWDGGDIRQGGQPNPPATGPASRQDSFLVTDGAGGGGTTPPPPPPKTRTCFSADTSVWIDGSLEKISEAKAGQKVGKVNCVSMTTGLEVIETVQEHEGSYECREIELESGSHISVVDAHCFLTESGKWIAAQNLKAGLKLKTLDGTVGIKSISTRTLVGKVYNLKMQGTDRYPVGRDAVIVRDW